MKTPILIILISFFPVFLSQPSRDCFAQQPEREGYIRTTDGVSLFYKVVGSGNETLVAVHGGPANTHESLLADLEPLAKNRRIIYYDQRGNGRSTLLKGAEELAVSKHVADLEAIRNHFKLEKLTLLGNSWGGMLIGFYATAHPERVERLIFLCSGEPTKALSLTATQETVRRIEERYNSTQRLRLIELSNPNVWIEAADPKAVCHEYFTLMMPLFIANKESLGRFKGDVCAASKDVLRYQQFVNRQIWSSLGDWNLLPLLGAVKAPVLVIHGVADTIPAASSEAWAAAIPNARLLVVKDGGHLLQAEQPEITLNAIEIFLKGGWPREAQKVLR